MYPSAVKLLIFSSSKTAGVKKRARISPGLYIICIFVHFSTGPSAERVYEKCEILTDTSIVFY